MAIYGIRKIKKTRVKTENNFTIYETVQECNSLYALNSECLSFLAP